MPRLRALTAIAVATSLALAACGGDNGTTNATVDTATSTEAPTKTLSTKDFVKRGNAICTAVGKGLAPIAATVKTDADVLAAVAKMVPVYRDGLERFRALGAPKDFDKTFDRFVDNAERQIEVLSKKPTKAGFKAYVKRVDELNKKNTALALALGLNACVSGA